MKSPLTRYERGDFVPIVIGGVLLFLSLPPFILLLAGPDRESLALAAPLLVLFGVGNILGFGFLWFGIRLCSSPGSLVYRITHGRPFCGTARAEIRQHRSVSGGESRLRRRQNNAGGMR